MGLEKDETSLLLSRDRGENCLAVNLKVHEVNLARQMEHFLNPLDLASSK